MSWRNNLPNFDYRMKSKKKKVTQDAYHDLNTEKNAQLVELNTRLINENANKRRELNKRHEFMNWWLIKKVVYPFFKKFIYKV
jgi:hypothetical protein